MKKTWRIKIMIFKFDNNNSEGESQQANTVGANTLVCVKLTKLD